MSGPTDSSEAVGLDFLALIRSRVATIPTGGNVVGVETVPDFIAVAAGIVPQEVNVRAIGNGRYGQWGGRGANANIINRIAIGANCVVVIPLKLDEKAINQG